VLDDPARVRYRLTVDHQHRHPALTAQRLDFRSPGASLRHDHLMERNALAP
jgi:hypothetical protein